MLSYWRQRQKDFKYIRRIGVGKVAINRHIKRFIDASIDIRKELSLDHILKRKSKLFKTVKILDIRDSVVTRELSFKEIGVKHQSCLSGVLRQDKQYYG